MRAARLLASLCVLLALSNAARAQEDFYKGKTVRIVIGTAVGASYGVFAQVVARHLGRFIPGEPALVPVAMPGAGGLVALNHLANVAPKDGTVISVIHVTLVQESLFNDKANFDARDFKWIGRLDSLGFVGLASKSSGIKTLEDARKREIIAGSPGLNNVPAQAPLVLNRIGGTRFKLISGYSGVGQVFLALERGEVEVAVASLATMSSVLTDKLKNGDLLPFFVQAGQRLKQYPDIPAIGEFARSDAEKAFMKVFTLTSDLGRALAATPGVPDDRMTILRNAWRRMMDDPGFKADAAKVGLDLDPLDADALAKMVRDAMDMEPPLRAEVKKFYDQVLGGAQ